jgi:DNA-binding transcriptional regulator YhcF (GntR family)
MIRSGVLPPESRLPAIRHLANDLGVAVNTIGRAYRELELDGLVAPRGRHGTVVLAPSAGAAADQRDLESAAATLALEATHRGLDVNQALDAVRAAFLRLDPPGRTT